MIIVWALRVIAMILILLGSLGAGSWLDRDPATAGVFLVLFALPGVLLLVAFASPKGSE
jgi:hypothetical protein